MTAPSTSKRSKAIENKTAYQDANTNRAKQMKGLPEPKAEYEKDKIDIPIDAQTPPPPPTLQI